MTLRQLLVHFRRFPRDAEVIACDVSVIVDGESGLTQSLFLVDLDEDEDLDDPEREDLPQGQPDGAKVVPLTRRGVA